jgi:hypothetical protein
MWSKVVTTWGTRASFLRDTVDWWRIFYERQVFSFTTKQPNEAHHAGELEHPATQLDRGSHASPGTACPLQAPGRIICKRTPFANS